MSKVALVRCESYEEKTVEQAVGKGLSLLGGVSGFVKGGENILLKPNILVGEHPDKCVTTHPAVFRAVAKLFKEAVAKISYGDSPAMGSLTKAAKKTGLAEVASELNLDLADFRTGEGLFFEKGLQKRKFTLAKAVIESDVVISIPKLKTHGLEKMTGAVKNQFGCIPGMLKGEFHLRLPNADEFAKMLVDLNKCISPRLYIMDGITGMEGNGPRGGKPRQMNLLLFSSDPVALDATVCRLVNVEPEYVPTVKYGMQAGMGTYLEEEIDLVGDDFNGFALSDFDIDRKPLKPFKNGKFWSFFNRRIVPLPFVEIEKCIGCKACVNICPARPKAVFFREEEKIQVPEYNYDNCIRCFCCQEICPEHAIQLKKPVLRRIIDWIT